MRIVQTKGAAPNSRKEPGSTVKEKGPIKSIKSVMETHSNSEDIEFASWSTAPNIVIAVLCTIIFYALFD
jgi:hypothetical protein